MSQPKSLKQTLSKMSKRNLLKLKDVVLEKQDFEQSNRKKVWLRLIDKEINRKQIMVRAKYRRKGIIIAR